jgi:hypothetical protein
MDEVPMSTFWNPNPAVLTETRFHSEDREIEIRVCSIVRASETRLEVLYVQALWFGTGYTRHRSLKMAKLAMTGVSFSMTAQAFIFMSRSKEDS